MGVIEVQCEKQWHVEYLQVSFFHHPSSVQIRMWASMLKFVS